MLPLRELQLLFDAVRLFRTASVEEKVRDEEKRVEGHADQSDFAQADGFRGM